MTELVAAVSLRYTAGDDITLEFTVTDEDDAAVTITGMTLRFVVARKLGATAVLSTEASPATATASITDGANGVFQVSMDSANTSGLSGTYRFEAEIEDSSGDKSTVAWGYITFDAALIN